MTRWVYSFGNGSAEGHAGLKDLLGGKGANLAEMSALGLPVPPGFTITTEVCAFYHANNKTFPPGLKQQIDEALSRLGNLGDPLLVAVRSGAPTSMPGMMDTILNLGLTESGREALAHRHGARVADDCYRRLEQMFAEAAPDVPLPQAPQAQLWGAIGAVLESWNSPRAIQYRRMFDIADAPGTAVTVQAMVFGNRGTGSASGVAFTRDPSTGEKRLTGEYLPGMQGDDLVSGAATPMRLSQLAAAQPETFAQLAAIATKLESHFRDMQDFEFTLEEGRLYILQTRDAKRSAEAMLKLAVDMANEGLIDRREAVARIDVDALTPLFLPVLDAEAAGPPLARGRGASPGAMTGKIAFGSEDMAARGDFILVREEVTPRDFSLMRMARGLLTARGGVSAHPTLVARAMGLPFVTGVEALRIDLLIFTLTIDDVVLRRGDVITIDGARGQVFAGAAPLHPPPRNRDLDLLLTWCDDILNSARGNAPLLIEAEKGCETHDAMIRSTTDREPDSVPHSPIHMSLMRLKAAQNALRLTRATI